MAGPGHTPSPRWHGALRLARAGWDGLAWLLSGLAARVAAAAGACAVVLLLNVIGLVLEAQTARTAQDSGRQPEANAPLQPSDPRVVVSLRR